MRILEFHKRFSNIQFFGRVYKITRIDCYLHHVCPSALVVSLSAWKTWLPTEQIFMEFGNRRLSKIYRENSSLIKT